MELSFEEAAAGVSTKIRLPRQELCDACKGTGAKAGTGVATCETLQGPRPAAYQQGFFSISRTCPQCQGAGQMIRGEVPGLPGSRPRRAHSHHRSAHPAGRGFQTRIRIPNEGEPGANGAPPGDLYIVLDIKEHPFYERRGADLYCTVPVSITQAALGAELSVPGLNGEEKVPIPEGTQTGSIIRLKAKGLPDPHGGGKGDLYVNVRVMTPTKLTREQRLPFSNWTTP